MENVLITGSNRGIGLELVRQYLQRTDTQVFAACRQPDQAAALHQLASASQPDRCHVIALEVTDEASRQAAVQQVSQVTSGLDILINNAAINLPDRVQDFDGIDTETMLHILHVNTVAPLMVTKAFIALLKQGKHPRLINISSELGSITNRSYGDDYGYSTAKAGLNMVTRGLAIDLRGYGIISISLDPGWVQTDMGGEDASLTPSESVRGIIQVIDGLKSAQNGSYLRWNGTSLPW
ncbi:MAG TPA: SDR family oxidoreductase [Phototrophicaceae bacterium]|jgi:NAD(P)-dependent dehydrogenase (short-subunit alcohol dehydrogenase family)|nr:SDR family oxidoreductase [Phototrophicaceae bacterium]